MGTGIHASAATSVATTSAAVAVESAASSSATLASSGDARLLELLDECELLLVPEACPATVDVPMSSEGLEAALPPQLAAASPKPTIA
jgi:hypothetical protein